MAPTATQANRFVLAGMLSAVAASSIYVLRRGDLDTYIHAGYAVLLKRDIYTSQLPGNNTWPPFFSVLCVPLALLDTVTPYLARGVWVAMTWVAILFALHLVAKLVYGKTLSFRTLPPESSLWVGSPQLMIPLFLTLYYFMDNFAHHQIDVLLFTVTLGGLYLQSTGRGRLGGVMLGAAAATKVMPIVFLPYLLYRRRWRAAAWGSATAAILSLSPALIFGWRTFLHYGAAWLQIARNDWDPRFRNVSVYAMWDRIIGHGLFPFAKPDAGILAWSGAPGVSAAWGLTLALAVGASLWVFRREPPPAGWRVHLEWSVVFIASAIFGPVGWAHYLVVMLLPNAILFAAWRYGPLAPRARRVVGGILLASLLFTIPLPHGRLDTAPLITWAALLMMACLLWCAAKFPVALAKEQDPGA